MKLMSLMAAVAFAASTNVLAACPTGTTQLGNVFGKEACGLKGRYVNDLVLSADKTWVLQGGVFIGNDNNNNATLSIQAGTKIIGQSGADFLVVTRGSKIMANGRADAPIIFTGAKESGRKRGEWGGLVINGNAPINSCGDATQVCEAEGEGNTGFYGGNNTEDNSGVLRYVRVEFAGYEITPNNELNGIAFQGVGAGTTIEYVQSHMGADDGIEFFGGTANMKYIVISGAKDDSLDWTSGWRGKAQFVVIQQYDDAANNGIEADNLSSPMNAEPRSNPTLSNLTMIGTTSGSAKGGEGVLLKVGSGAAVYNSIITGFKSSCIDLDDKETFENAARYNNELERNEVVFENNLISCQKNINEEAGDVYSLVDFVMNQSENNLVDAQLNGWVPSATSPALQGGVTPFDFFFDFVDHIGAIKDESSDWSKGWTTDARN